MRAILLCFVIGFLFSSCLKEFIPPTSDVNRNYLVVDGTIAAGDTTTFKLSRTINLNDTVEAVPENGAQVQVESEAGEIINFDQGTLGQYRAATPATTGRFRIRIVDTKGKTYVSDFVDVKTSPPIDSLEWKEDNNIFIYVNTHDDSRSSRYYRWEFEETVEYHSVYDSNIDFVNGQLVFIGPDQLRTVCFKYFNSNEILISSSGELGADVISKFLLTTIPNDNSKISFRYSILAKQYVLTPEAFTYWRIVRQNSEQTGNIFDPQPSQLYSNIKCVDDPEEPVIGYLSASTVSVKRLFIRQSELNTIIYPNTDFCKEEFIDPATAAQYLTDGKLMPAYYRMSDGFLAIAPAVCVDCRLSGGSTAKPSYW